MRIKNLVLIGIAVGTLAMETLNVQAQERYSWFDCATNLGPFYTNAITYVTNNAGVITTNPATFGGYNTTFNSTNSSSTNGTSAALPVTNIIGGAAFYLGDYQGQSLGVLQTEIINTNPANASTTLGTNGIHVDLVDLSPDGIIWFSNKFGFTNTGTYSGLNGPYTNSSYDIFPCIPTVGTNPFTMWRYARWGESMDYGTNQVNTAQALRFYRFR